MGSEIYKLQSYVSWYLVVNIIAFTGSIMLLKYYYHRNYRLAFSFGIVSVLSNFIFTIIVYIIMSSGKLAEYYMPALLFNSFAIIIYLGGFIFSNIRKRFWLKLAGWGGSLAKLVFVLALIEGIYSKDAWLVKILGKIIQWSPIVWYLVNVMFIMNFLVEFRTSKTENANGTMHKILASISVLILMGAVILTGMTGKSLINESISHVDWRKYNAAQEQQLINLAGGARTFIDSEGDSLKYLLITPLNYERQKKYPLVVCLPYAGYAAAAAAFLSIDEQRNTYPAFIFVPFCPEGEGWGGVPNYRSLESVVFEAISELHEPRIDIKKRYITGVSRGGYGTWEFICTYPNMFAAAVPVCGGGDPDLASKIVNMPIWAFHGANDKNVPVSGSRDMISAIRNAGGNPRYTEYPYGTHNIWNNVVETPDLWKWLFAQKRK